MNPFERFLSRSAEEREEEIKKDSEDLNKKRVVGKITKLNEGGGWGFISSMEIKFTRIFFHWSALRQDTLKFPELRIGMKVEFTPVEVEGKGWRAIRVKVVE